VPELRPRDVPNHDDAAVAPGRIWRRRWRSARRWPGSRRSAGRWA